MLQWFCAGLDGDHAPVGLDVSADHTRAIARYSSSGVAKGLATDDILGADFDEGLL